MQSISLWSEQGLDNSYSCTDDFVYTKGSYLLTSQKRRAGHRGEQRQELRATAGRPKSRTELYGLLHRLLDFYGLFYRDNWILRVLFAVYYGFLFGCCLCVCYRHRPRLPLHVR